MAQKGRGIFMVYVDIDAQHVQQFNEWYNKEHLPELLSVPGILSAARYEALKGGPQYLACYELESVAVMQTPAFTNRPRTPWGQKVSPSVIGKNLTRIVGEQIYPDGMEMPERGMACQRRRENVSAGRSKTASRMDAKCPREGLCCATNRMRCLTGECTRDVEPASPSVLPLAQLSLRPAPAPLLNPKSMLSDVGPVELWATRWRRPSAAPNPQGFCWQ